MIRRLIHRTLCMFCGRPTEGSIVCLACRDKQEVMNPYHNPVQRWLWQVGYNFGYRTAGRVFRYRIVRSIGYWWFGDPQ